MTAIRLDKWKVLIAFGAGLAIVVLVANIVVLVATPGSEPAPCATGPRCPPPVEPLVSGVRWTSVELGYSFEYEGWFSIASQDRRGVKLRLDLSRLPDRGFGGERSSVSLVDAWVSAVPAAERTPQELFEQRRDELSQQVLGLEEDTDSGTTILGPSIGHVDGVGGSYVGTLDSAQGPTGRAVVAIFSAGNARISAVFSYVLGGSTLDPNQTRLLRRRGDLMLSKFRWPT